MSRVTVTVAPRESRIKLRRWGACGYAASHCIRVPIFTIRLLNQLIPV